MNIVQERPRRARTLRERLLSRAIINPETGCWEWSGRIDPAGYGHITVGGRSEGSVYTHRLAYELIEGPIGDGLVIDHLCRNRSCCNPAHLEPVTQRENVLRSPIARAAINAAKTHCDHGHEFSSANTYVRKDGRRVCRACRSRWAQKSYNQRRNRTTAIQGVSS